METKDYFSLPFSGLALALSIYNALRARRDGRAIAKQRLEQAKSEAIVLSIEARSSLRDARGALAAASFEATMANDETASAEADELIKELEDSLTINAELETSLRRFPTATAQGTADEALLLERVLADAKANAAANRALAKSAAELAEAIRRALRVAQERSRLAE